MLSICYEGKCAAEAKCLPNHLGVSETRGPGYSTLNSRILSIRIPKVPLIFGKSHCKLPPCHLSEALPREPPPSFRNFEVHAVVEVYLQTLNLEP